MAFDGFVLNAVTSELTDYLINGKIQKIYQPNSDEILLGIYSNGTQYALSINISSHFYSVYLTTSKKENPLVAPNFCMLLRKHLIGYHITNISTCGLERILTIELSGKDNDYVDNTKKLVVELMGKYSNILLLNDNNIIIDSLRHFLVKDGANRDVMPKVLYVPPKSDKLDISDYALLKDSLTIKRETQIRDELKEQLENMVSLSDFFVNHFTGVSKTLIEYSISSLKIANVLTTENYHKLINYLLELKNNITTHNVKCTLLKNNNYTLENCLDEQNMLSINFFLDDYYSKKQEKEQFISYRNQLLHFISAKFKKLAKKLSGIEEKLKECEHMEEYKLYGELITSYLYQIPKEHVSHILLPNYYDNQTLVNIPLDISLSPTDNAKKYFKKYHKLKNTFSIVQEQKVELQKEIAYLESIVYEIESAESIKALDAVYEEIQDSFVSYTKPKNQKVVKKKLNKKKNTLSEPISYMVHGYQVLVGKNNKQNDELTFRIANKKDIWFHVQDLHGSHVILKTEGKNPSQEIINSCASIAAYHSKAVASSNVSVDYTYIKYVKKPSKAKPGMVVYTNQQTVNVKPKI